MASQTPLATCSAEPWTFNSQDQSPCEVGSTLAGVCTGGPFILPPLPANSQYLGPTQQSENACRCSSVYYALLSACAHCQGGQFLRWSAYSTNCTDVTVGSFPRPIPPGLVVPQWAFQDVSSSDNWNVTLSQNTVGPEVTGPPRNVSSTESRAITSNSSPESSSTRSTIDIPTESAIADPDTKPTNAGAIVGGTVGGIVSLALLGLLIFFLRRGRLGNRRQVSNIDEPPWNPPVARPPLEPSGPTTTETHATTHLAGTNSATVAVPYTRPFKIYNPDDPSTWPDNYDMFPNSHHKPNQLSDSSHPSFYRPEHVERILPMATGMSSVTAISQARTTFDDTRRDYEM